MALGQFSIDIFGFSVTLAFRRSPVTGIEKHEIERRLEHLEHLGRHIEHGVEKIERMVECLLRPHHISPTDIRFKELTMNPTSAGQTQVYTGTLSPAGAVFPTDTLFAVTSNYPTETPTVDATGLIVSVTYSAGFVEDPNNLFAISYSATSASTGGSLSKTITPSAPAVFPTDITFVQTT